MEHTLTLISVKPVGTGTGITFLDFADGSSSLVSTRNPLYPSSPNGIKLHRIRKEARLTLRQVCEIIRNVRPSAIVALEEGAMTLAESDWAWVFATLEEFMIPRSKA